MLLNIGPTHYGQISPIYEERLRDIGHWLNINGEAIYSTTAWTHQNDTTTPGVWYTQSKIANTFGTKPVYAIILFWPEDNVVQLGSPSAGPITHLSFLGYNGTIEWNPVPTGLEITFPPRGKTSNDWAWVVFMNNLVD